mgnify:CR=1 FL=1
MNEIFRFHHEDGEHTHPHEHGHSHSHEGCDPHDCAACGSCDPMQETVALLQYMVNHNAAHANELAQLGRKLTELGNREALPPFPSLKRAICACPPCSLL